jgi:hypothetical protein
VLVGADGGETAPVGAADLAEGHFLAAEWADVVGVGRIATGENYWQSFSFLEAVDRARGDGLPVDAGWVSRNRTLATLAADVAAARGVSR